MTPTRVLEPSRDPVDRPKASWWPWIPGLALVAAVVLAASHLSEGHVFLVLAAGARPGWLLLALVCQAGTYVAQGEIWRGVARAAGARLSRTAALELSIAKLFVDQALPSAGVSSSVLVAGALERERVPRAAALATVAVNIASYHAAYLLGLAVAIPIAMAHGLVNAAVYSLAVVFSLTCLGMIAGVLALTGRPLPAIVSRLDRVSVARRAVRFLEDADRRLVTNPTVTAQAVAFQVVIIALDTATMLFLIRSLGVTAFPSTVFVSFMISSLFRTMGVLPGGLGTFEATSVLTLRAVGVSIPVALSATLLFRGLSFWLPMLPGWWCSHRLGRRARALEPSATLDAYWSQPVAALLEQVGSRPEGLSGDEAARRVRDDGATGRLEGATLSRARVMLRQVRSPLLWLLVFAATVSAATREWSDAAIVLAIILATVAVGYVREYRAERAVAALRARIQASAIVLRDGQPTSVARSSVVVGDVVQLSAGSLIPADAVVLQATDCFVSEAALTGESFPIQKRPGVLADSVRMGERTNCVFLGANVRSGTAQCLVVATGGATQLAGIAARLVRPAPETDFDRGIRHFGYLLTSAMLVMVLVVFVAHMLLGHPPIETLLFSVALAVGLSPELLPAILSINLARGAQAMARRGVLVRRLNAIENLGSMNVLCTDKTGTLTEGVVELEGAYDADGVASASVLEDAATNAFLQAGSRNPLDDAILTAHPVAATALIKRGELPFDFVRKRVSVVVERADGPWLVTKGAFDNVIAVCTRTIDGTLLDDARRSRITERYQTWSQQGVRVLALAVRQVPTKGVYDRADEAEMAFAGFVTFLDRPKAGVERALRDLDRLGVAVKLITGDNRLVARHICGLIGMRIDRMLTGADLEALDEVAFARLAPSTSVFAEVDPNQKERIIRALRKSGHVVGFLGDGVNDAPAMHAADTSLSVEHAVDVARETADFVLLDRDLDVIRGGIEEGRRTFANTMKYILTTTSANLGNMISMALASLVLPFLPLLAGQILLNNLLSDVPAVGIADDNVDASLISQPPRWDLPFIGRFMAEFGLISSCFDVITFGVLLWGFHASVELFRTGWFVESLLTELMVALVIRTRRPFFKSRPGSLLLWSSVVMIALTPAIPYVPLSHRLGFVPLPTSLLATMLGITVAYIGATELGKLWFYRTRR